MNKQNSKHKKLVQFWLCGIGFTIGMVVLFGLGYILCHLVTWQSYETPYILLKMAEFGIAPALFLAGWGFLIYRFSSMSPEQFLTVPVPFGGYGCERYCCYFCRSCCGWD